MRDFGGKGGVGGGGGGGPGSEIRDCNFKRDTGFGDFTKTPLLTPSIFAKQKPEEDPRRSPKPTSSCCPKLNPPKKF